jgi:hypothetical protein
MEEMRNVCSIWEEGDLERFDRKGDRLILRWILGK